MIEPITAEQMQANYLYTLHKQGLVTIHKRPKTTARLMAERFAMERGIDQKQFFGTTRIHTVAHPRQDCMAMLYRETNLSMPQIGRIFKRDHTTVLHGINASNARADQEASQ